MINSLLPSNFYPVICHYRRGRKRERRIICSFTVSVTRYGPRTSCRRWRCWKTNVAWYISLQIIGLNQIISLKSNQYVRCFTKSVRFLEYRAKYSPTVYFTIDRRSLLLFFSFLPSLSLITCRRVKHWKFLVRVRVCTHAHVCFYFAFYFVTRISN